MFRRIFIACIGLFYTGMACAEVPSTPSPSARQEFEQTAKQYLELSEEEQSELIAGEGNPLEEVRAAAAQQQPQFDAIPSADEASAEDRFASNMMYALSVYSSAHKFVHNYFGTPDRRKALRVLFFIYCQSVKMYESHCYEKGYPIGSKWSLDSYIGGWNIRGAFTAIEATRKLQDAVMQMFFVLQSAGDISESVNIAGNSLYVHLRNFYRLFEGNFSVYDNYLYDIALEYFVPVIYHNLISKDGGTKSIGHSLKMDSFISVAVEKLSDELIRPTAEVLTSAWSYVPTFMSEPIQDAWYAITASNPEMAAMTIHVNRLGLYFAFLYLTSNHSSCKSDLYHITINKVSSESFLGFASRFFIGVGSRVLFAQAVISGVRALIKNIGLTYYALPVLDVVGSAADFLCITDKNVLNSRAAYSFIRNIILWVPRYFVDAVENSLSEQEISDLARTNFRFKQAMQVLGAMNDTQAMTAAVIGMSPQRGDNEIADSIAEKIEWIENAVGPEKMNKVMGAIVDNFVDSTVFSPQGILTQHWMFPYLMRFMGSSL